MRIRKIKINNFKRFENLEVELSPFDCLVGGNNSGKSTILQALALFDFILHNCLALKSSYDNNHKKEVKNFYEIKNRSIAPEEFVVLPVANAIDLWTNKIAQRGGKHILIEIEVEYDNSKKVKASVDLNFNRYSVSIDTSNDQEWLEKLIKFKISYLPVFSAFLTQEEKRTRAVIEDAINRGRVNSVIRNLLLELKLKNDIHRLEEVLRKAMPTFKNLSIKFDEVTNKYIEVLYKEEEKRKSFDLFMAGSGFQQFVYLFGFIFLKDPDVILLDEPDVHLHGSLQATLINELKSLVQNQNKQVIFATHSGDIISRLEPDYIISLNGTDAQRLNVAFEKYDLLNQLGSFDNIQIVKLQEFKRLIIVEDQDDWKFIQIFGKKVLGENHWHLVEKRLSVFPAKGNPCKQDIQRLKNQLSEMLQISGDEPLCLFGICDWDYNPEREEIISRLNKNRQIIFHIWQKAEIENYLIIPDAIERAVKLKNKHGKNMPEAEFISQKINELVNECRDDILDKIAIAVEEYSISHRLGWNISRKNQEARRLFDLWWEKDKLGLVDAKEFILPQIKKMFQEMGLAQFTNHFLAETIKPEEIDGEVKNLINEIARFAGYN